MFTRGSLGRVLPLVLVWWTVGWGTLADGVVDQLSWVDDGMPWASTTPPQPPLRAQEAQWSPTQQWNQSSRRKCPLREVILALKHRNKNYCYFAVIIFFKNFIILCYLLVKYMDFIKNSLNVIYMKWKYEL